MKRVRLVSPSQVLMLLAVIAQLILPVANASPADPLSGSWCNPSGRGLSLGAQAARTDLLIALGLVGEVVGDDHCPACVAAHGVPLPVPVVLPPTAYAAVTVPAVRVQAVLPSLSRGPPLGSRAPPRLV